MSDAPFTPDEVRWMVTELQDTGMSSEEVAYTFEFTPEELAMFLGGADHVWLNKITPDYERRLHARLLTTATASERRAEENIRHAQATKRVAELLDRPGVTEGMSLGDAVAAGLITEEEIKHALSGFSTTD